MLIVPVSFRHHYGELISAEENKDDVDTAKYAKKQRIDENYFESSAYSERGGESHRNICDCIILLASSFLFAVSDS